MSTSLEKLDCVIVGAGPAGLTALEYLSRFHRKAVVLGARGPQARLLSIDRSYNVPGFPGGISGQELLARLSEQALKTGGVIREETALSVEGQDDNFTVHLSNGAQLLARKIVLAMGVRDRVPDVSNIEPHIGHFVRYCPVCDGYEHTGKNLGILGAGSSVARHALFLRTFSHQITVFLHGEDVDSLGSHAGKLREKGIEVVAPRIQKIIELRDDLPLDSVGESEPLYEGCGVILEDGTRHQLDVLYSALGCDLTLEPVKSFDLNLDSDGYVVVDSQQETSVPGIYAAGDLVSQINQISVAFGQAAIASVSIQNRLHDDKPELEDPPRSL
jgi:thioredoxin reductase (NADPH)